MTADLAFSHSEGDSKDVKHNKDTNRMVFSPDRFMMSKMYREDNFEKIIDPRGLTAFVDQVLNGERPLWWASSKQKPEKYS